MTLWSRPASDSGFKDIVIIWMKAEVSADEGRYFASNTDYDRDYRWIFKPEYVDQVTEDKMSFLIQMMQKSD